MQQMIPHHENAVNMAKLLLKQSTQEELDAVEDLEDILHDIINTQNFQIHQFRNYLNPDGNLLQDSPVLSPTLEDSEDDKHDHDSHDDSAASKQEGFFSTSLLSLIVSAAASLALF